MKEPKNFKASVTTATKTENLKMQKPIKTLMTFGDSCGTSGDYK